MLNKLTIDHTGTGTVRFHKINDIKGQCHEISYLNFFLQRFYLGHI